MGVRCPLRIGHDSGEGYSPLREKFDGFSVKMTQFSTCFSAYKHKHLMLGVIHPCPPLGYALNNSMLTFGYSVTVAYMVRWV